MLMISMNSDPAAYRIRADRLRRYHSVHPVFNAAIFAALAWEALRTRAPVTPDASRGGACASEWVISDTTDNMHSANNFFRAGYCLFSPRNPWLAEYALLAQGT